MLRIHPAISASAVIALAILLSDWFSGSAVAQPLTETSDTTLKILAKTPLEMTDKLLKRNLELGLDEMKKYGGSYTSLDTPVLITSATFDALVSILGDGVASASAAPTQGLSWRQAPSRETTWELSLPQQNQMMTDLTIVYKKAGAVQYSTAKGTMSNRSFSRLQPGNYSVNLIADDIPQKYSAKYEELGPDNKVVPKEINDQKFPEFPRYYSVTIHGFKGDEKKLFELMKDEKILPNKLLNVEPLKNFRFSFANFQDMVPVVPEGVLEGQNYIARIPKVEGAVKRVWMLFPLSKDDVEAKMKELEDKDREDLPKLIRQDKSTITADNRADGIDPKSPVPARWFELSDTYKGNVDSLKYQTFGRDIPLTDFRALANRFPEVYRIVLWEFDNGKDQFAIGVKDTDGKTTIYVRKEEIKALPGALKERANKQQNAKQP